MMFVSDHLPYASGKAMIYRLLTDRQGAVLRLTCDGRTDQEIAVTLGISLNAIMRHRHNIRQRLGRIPFDELCRMIDEAAPPRHGTSDRDPDR
jgi:DNA-binding NarL/FixJ family response regulator